jgi:hypothetical protein
MLHGMTNSQEFPKYSKFRKMHDGLYVTIPREYVYARDLKALDDILLLPEPDGIKIKFLALAVEEPA